MCRLASGQLMYITLRIPHRLSKYVFALQEGTTSSDSGNSDFEQYCLMEDLVTKYSTFKATNVTSAKPRSSHDGGKTIVS